MRIDDFIWLDQFEEKLEVKHNVFPEEAEEVFRSRPRFKKIGKGHVRGENLYRALGQTEWTLFGGDFHLQTNCSQSIGN